MTGTETNGKSNDELTLVEIYTTVGCAFCAAAREDLEWRGVAFVEHNVEKDAAALARMLEITHGARTVPVIVEENQPVKIGWMGRGCFIGSAP